MKLFLKYATIALGIQTVMLLFLGLAGNLISPAVDSLFELLLRIYEPMIVLIAKVARFRGESAIIEPVWMGIALGVLSYSLLFGFAALLLKRGR
jgi:hypothetical protein